jgi:hypothetical protein
MTNNEEKLIEIIRNSDNPNALAIAVEIISKFVKPPLSSQEQEIVAPMEHA